jgi:hypothetical protein
MNRIALLIFAFFACADASHLQAGQGQPSPCHIAQPGKTMCEAVLCVPMATKTNKVGDHIFLRTHLVSDSPEKPVTVVEGAIVEVHTGVSGHRILRIQIGTGINEDGHEFSITARIVAVVSPSNVSQLWVPPMIWVDSFPASPEGDQRQPGERTLSEDPHHLSSVDSLSNFPISRTVVCSEKANQPSPRKCTDLLAARGSFGFHAVSLETGTAPIDSILRSKKEMSFPPGTLLVLEMGSISPTH